MREHKPVLVKEVLHFLDVKPGRKYIDATVGGGGHAEVILAAGGQVLGIDRSAQSLELAEKRLKKARFADDGESRRARPGVFRLVQDNFSNIVKIAQKFGWSGSTDGVLFDLGFASFQVGDPDFGLSFRQEGLLDMRLDPSLGVTAADLVNSLPEGELSRLFREFGDERYAKQIAARIVRRRGVKQFETTTELAGLVEDVYSDGRGSNSGFSQTRIHPATKVFMALRIAVNSEFENLQNGLAGALAVIRPGGRIVAISFHSGEDRIVKNFFRQKYQEGLVRILTKKPIVPDLEEKEMNPASRSARMRAAEKVA